MVGIVSKVLYTIAIVLQSSVAVRSIIIPSFVKPCSVSDPNLNNCIGRVAQAALKQFVKGIPELGVPVLDPAILGKIVVDNNGLKILLENSTMTGLYNGKVDNYKLNMKKNALNMDVVANITLKGMYRINGRVLILPVVGDGPYTVDLRNLKMSIKYKFDTVKNDDGKSHWIMRVAKRSYHMEKAQFDFQNLFGGNKLIGDTTLAFLNSNWEIIMKDIASPAVDQVMEVCLNSINQLYSKIPVNELLRP